MNTRASASFAVLHKLGAKKQGECKTEIFTQCKTGAKLNPLASLSFAVLHQFCIQFYKTEMSSFAVFQHPYRVLTAELPKNHRG
jgi:hypothetical protein